MQNAVDAAALAASQEITAAVYAAGQGQGSANIDANSIAVEAARNVAAEVAEANGVFVDPDADVAVRQARLSTRRRANGPSNGAAHRSTSSK